MSDETEEVTTPQTKPRAPRPPTAVGVQIWDENESRWDDLGIVHEDGATTVFDSTAEARQFMKMSMKNLAGSASSPFAGRTRSTRW